jgi:hypothetical protein
MKKNGRKCSQGSTMGDGREYQTILMITRAKENPDALKVSNCGTK